MATQTNEITAAQIWKILAGVYDPEIPVLSIVDLGVVRDVCVLPQDMNEPGKPPQVEVVITPTYSGCPAMDVISFNIRAALDKYGFNHAKVSQLLFPVWTTNWITEKGRQELTSYGIAPPAFLQKTAASANATTRLQKMLFAAEPVVQCPQCNSENTSLQSQFGSTACKALYRCNDCKEPFDYFKCH